MEIGKTRQAFRALHLNHSFGFRVSGAGCNRMFKRRDKNIFKETFGLTFTIWDNMG